MRRPLKLRIALGSALLAVFSGARSSGADFARDVRPVLEKHCIGCHGERKPKAGVNLSKFKDDRAVKQDPDLWTRVVEVVGEHVMPPKEKPAPTDLEREQFLGTVQAMLDAIAGIRDPGPGPIQRLTRDQYNNTVRDLLGVDSHPADAFPADGGGGEGFDNNASTLFVAPILMEKYLAAASAVLDQADPARFLTACPDAETSSSEAARQCIERFTSLAFRRPATLAEITRLMRLFERASRQGASFDSAVQQALRGVLVSPHFLFLIEQKQERDGPYRIGEYELASRLSYFLWSSMPDDELFALAANGTLHDTVVLERQVRRMLADRKARAFAQSFAGQWMRVASLATAAEPDRRRFPEYTPELRDAMIEESIVFFHNLLREDRSLLDLIGADYVYVNELLAKHYGFTGVTGPGFRRVRVQDSNRGGVLGMAAVLTLTSYPRRTSPVLRGKWVLEELLGTPPPPPPPMVKVLTQDDRPRNGMNFRQRLEKHRSDPNCASCHAKLDPPGFALELFDPIGRWRTEISGEKIDAKGELQKGQTFEGPAELKALLLKEKKDLFLRNITQRMLSYALRRGLEYYDGPTVKQIVEAVQANDCRSTVLVTEVVKSLPFQYRRNQPMDGTEP
jgi:hypothetical protein